MDGAQLQGANFNDTYIETGLCTAGNDTNFTNANLTNATFVGATVDSSDIIWSNTTCPDGSNSSTNGT